MYCRFCDCDMGSASICPSCNRSSVQQSRDRVATGMHKFAVGLWMLNLVIGLLLIIAGFIVLLHDQPRPTADTIVEIGSGLIGVGIMQILFGSVLKAIFQWAAEMLKCQSRIEDCLATWLKGGGTVSPNDNTVALHVSGAAKE